MDKIPRCKTMRELATALGVDQSTVSLALRNDARLSEDTRHRIQKAAAESGYRPDPKLAALMHYLRSRNSDKKRETIAFICHASLEHRLKQPSGFGLQLAGVLRRAEQLGFAVNRFVIGAGGYSLTRLNGVVAARGIRAVVLGPIPIPQEERLIGDFDWDNVSAVAFNFRFPHPRIHRVASDHASGMHLTLNKLWEAGYRRIGLVLGAHQDVATRGLWRLTYAGWMTERGMRPFLFSVRDENAPTGTIADWLQANELDAFVGLCADVVPVLKSRGLKCPLDFGFARLDWYENLSTPCAGVNQFHAYAGECAVDLLDQCLRRNQLGVTHHARLEMVLPSWVDGPTVRSVTNTEQSRV